MLRYRSAVLWVALLFTTLGTWLSIAPVQAHGYIVRSIPADRAVLERAPTRLQYWFSEPLEPQFSELNLRDENGEIILRGGVDERDSSLLRLRIPPDTLTDGAYIVELRPAFASDGHVVAESRVFFVGDAAADLQGTAASDLPQPLEIVWKTLLMAANFLLFGVFALYGLVLRPAWASPRHPVGGLPPRVMGRLGQIVGFGFGLALAGSVLALIQQTMIFFNADAGQVISGGLWQVVRIGSRFGDVWNVRILFLAVAAGLVVLAYTYRQTAPALTRAIWTGNTWLLAIIIGAQAVNSHAAGSLVWPWVGVFMHWLHALAVAFWIGGVLVLVAILPIALAPYEGEARRAALMAVMRRFSRYMVGTLLIVITSGMYNSSNWFFSASDVDSTYGTALGVKLLMVGLLLIVAALHHFALNPGLLKRFNTLTGPSTWAGRFAGSFRLEALIALIALATAAALSSTPIPQPEFTEREFAPTTAEQTVSDVTVGLLLAPGGPGVNTFDLVVRQGDEAVETAQVRVQTVDPSRDTRSAWQTADPVEPGLYVMANDTIDRAGVWWTLIDVRVAGETQRVAFTWEISADAAVIQSRPPTILGVLSLAAVLLVLAGLAYPPLAGFSRRYIDLTPRNALIAAGMIAITIGALVIAARLIDAQQQQIEAQINPPPEIINTVLPDAASLARGQAIYEQQCLTWVTSSDFPVLLRQVNTLRDATLFAIPTEGWRDLPACEGDLTVEQRWDVINYLRTLQTGSSNT